MIEDQIASISEKTKQVLKKSKPLAPGSVKAIAVVVHTPLAFNDFYIPEDAIG